MYKINQVLKFGAPLVLIAVVAACGGDSTSTAVKAAGSEAKVSKVEVAGGEACVDFGPQTPRDIDSVLGENTVSFPTAPAPEAMNLCNIHFHENAEHKAAAFSVLGGEGKHEGYQCGISKTLTQAELAPYPAEVCEDIQPGDTIEVHWVHSSCDVEPGPGLGSCLTSTCKDPKLRVETQVFTVVNDSNALDFDDFRYAGNNASGFHQAKSLPTGTGAAVQFQGSTTGPSYDESNCSPMKVNWSVRPQCAKVHIGSLARFCASNVFNEDHPHGVRKLVTNPKLLSPML